jgi:hypothetical protein
VVAELSKFTDWPETGFAEIFLGNGDGTFTETSASPISVPSELYSLKVGDFNHDGKIDIVGIDQYDDQIVLLIGAGDGTFTVTATTSAVSQIFLGPFAIVAADFNGDGVPDLAMLTKSVSTPSILLTVPTETATATVNGIAPVGAGTHNVDASYAGDRNYGAVTSGTIPLTGGLPLVGVSPNSLSFGNEAVGATSSSKTVTLKNTSTATLDISSIMPSGDFAISANICGATLAGKKSCKVSITFMPTVLGKLARVRSYSRTRLSISILNSWCFPFCSPLNTISTIFCERKEISLPSECVAEPEELVILCFMFLFQDETFHEKENQRR